MMRSEPIPAPFEEFEEFFPRAYSVAYRLLGSVEGAEDVASEALAKAFLHWPRIRDLPYREAWILRVATNLAIDSLRRRPPLDVWPAMTTAGEDGWAALLYLYQLR